MSKQTTDEAFRQWFASKEWADHEMNLLVDHDVSDELDEAIGFAMLYAFAAGAEWARSADA